MCKLSCSLGHHTCFMSFFKWTDIEKLRERLFLQIPEDMLCGVGWRLSVLLMSAVVASDLVSACHFKHRRLKTLFEDVEQDSLIFHIGLQLITRLGYMII